MSRLRETLLHKLEVVRKGIRFPNQAFPSGSGEPTAEGAVAFSTYLWGWIGFYLLGEVV